MFEVPVLYLVFNRPHETQQSFKILRKLRPAKLYVAADGARRHVTDDMVNTKLVREIIAGIDWPCELNTLFRDENLGCKKAVQSSLKWFFQHEEEGIILEDDILPNDAFFDFCKIMLNRYREDPAIFSINGCSIGYQSSLPYGLTRYFNMWGWATWKRSYQLMTVAWNSFDPAISLVKDDAVKASMHLPVTKTSNKIWQEHWEHLFKAVHNNTIDTWDYQWMYSAFKNNMYCIRPSQNYIVNIGFGETATHHKFTKSPICNLKYTATVYADKQNFRPAVDARFEINYVGKMVNAVPLVSWQDFISRLIPRPVKSVIKNLMNKKAAI